MGTFSFITSDTEKSVPAFPATYPGSPKQVFWLRPDADPTPMLPYDGYGVVEGVDLFEWCCIQNAAALGYDPADWTFEERRSVGIFLFNDEVFVDNEGDLFVVCVPEVSLFSNLWVTIVENYATKLTPDGKTPNDLIREGIWKADKFSNHFSLPYSIKIVERPVPYDQAKVSRIDPCQGFRYEETEH